jgi:hypothetical protein
MINATEVFPKTLWGDQDDIDTLEGKSTIGIVGHIFLPTEKLGLTLDDATIAGVTTFIVFGSIGSGLLFKNPVIPAVILMGFMYATMLVNSYDFFKTVFRQPWTGELNSPLIYLGIILGVAWTVVIFISLTEMVAQGRSGG